MRCLVWICLCLGVGWSSCQEDAPSVPGEADLPDFSTMEISEVQTGDAQTVTWKQTCRYDQSARLVSMEMSQTYIAVEPQEMREIAAFSYAGNQACLTDDSGNRWTYQLDESRGVAVSCVYQSASGAVRNYQFSYTDVPVGGYYLSGVTEILEGDTQPFSSLSIKATDDETFLVTKEIHGMSQSFRMHFFAQKEWVNAAQLPPHFLLELYPLSHHSAALYAHLLGDYPPNLLQRVVPVDNRYEESCTYSYDLLNDYPVRCEICVSSLGKDYLRQLDFNFEK